MGYFFFFSKFLNFFSKFQGREWTPSSSTALPVIYLAGGSAALGAVGVPYPHPPPPIFALFSASADETRIYKGIAETTDPFLAAWGRASSPPQHLPAVIPETWLGVLRLGGGPIAAGAKGETPKRQRRVSRTRSFLSSAEGELLSKIYARA